MLIFPTMGMPYLSGMLKLPEIAVATITWKDREGRAVSRKSWAGSDMNPAALPELREQTQHQVWAGGGENSPAGFVFFTLSIARMQCRDELGDGPVSDPKPCGAVPHWLCRGSAVSRGCGASSGSQDSPGVTHNDDLHRDGHPDLLHVLEVELLDDDQEHSTDQGIDQGGQVGLGQLFTNVNECLQGRGEEKGSGGARHSGQHGQNNGQHLSPQSTP